MCEQQKKPIAICHLSIIYYLCNRKEEHDGVIAGSVFASASVAQSVRAPDC